jgi:hypothetical protein
MGQNPDQWHLQQIIQSPRRPARALDVCRTLDGAKADLVVTPKTATSGIDLNQ